MRDKGGGEGVEVSMVRVSGGVARRRPDRQTHRQADTFTPLVWRTTRTQTYWTGIGLTPFVPW